MLDKQTLKNLKLEIPAVNEQIKNLEKKRDAIVLLIELHDKAEGGNGVARTLIEDIQPEKPKIRREYELPTKEKIAIKECVEIFRSHPNEGVNLILSVNELYEEFCKRRPDYMGKANFLMVIGKEANKPDGMIRRVRHGFYGLSNRQIEQPTLESFALDRNLSVKEQVEQIVDQTANYSVEDVTKIIENLKLVDPKAPHILQNRDELITMICDARLNLAQVEE